MISVDSCRRWKHIWWCVSWWISLPFKIQTQGFGGMCWCRLTKFKCESILYDFGSLRFSRQEAYNFWKSNLLFSLHQAYYILSNLLTCFCSFRASFPYLQVSGDSIYNLITLGEVETGKDDRPVDPPPKILSVEVPRFLFVLPFTACLWGCGYCWIIYLMLALRPTGLSLVCGITKVVVW